nr:MAG TPA: hypothetical protein [Bacteriophage sp.]
MVPFLLRRLSLSLMSQISGREFVFSCKNYSWEFLLEIYEFLELSKLNLNVDSLSFYHGCSYIVFPIPRFNINRYLFNKVDEPSNVMKAYYSLYLWMKENNMDYERWNNVNFALIKRIDYIHVDRTMNYDKVNWKDQPYCNKTLKSHLVVPISLFMNRYFLELIYLFYKNLYIQSQEEKDLGYISSFNYTEN